jgi:hypothetical protein
LRYATSSHTSDLITSRVVAAKLDRPAGAEPTKLDHTHTYFTTLIRFSFSLAGESGPGPDDERSARNESLSITSICFQAPLRGFRCRKISHRARRSGEREQKNPIL